MLMIYSRGIIMYTISVRRNSDYQKDKIAAKLFYLFVGIWAFVTFFTRSIYDHFRPDGTGSTLEYYIFFLFALFAIIGKVVTVADFANIKKVHKGTLKYYVTKINPAKESIIKGTFDVLLQYPAILGALTAIIPSTAVIFFVYYLCEGRLDVVLSGGVLMASFIVLFLSGRYLENMINSQKVPESELLKIDEIEDIHISEKYFFKKKMAELISEKGFVNRKDILNVYYNILIQKEERIKEEGINAEKNSYSNFTNSTKK